MLAFEIEQSVRDNLLLLCFCVETKNTNSTHFLLPTSASTMQSQYHSYQYSVVKALQFQMNAVPLTYLTTSKPTPILDQISAHSLLDSMNDIAIQNCYEQIVESIPTKDIILMLIKSSNDQLFSNICNILQSSFKQWENLKHDQKKNNSLNQLPTSTIYNICEFLDRNDMGNFKLCSISTALIIFEIMKCCTVGIVNMNELILNPAYKYSQKLDLFNKVKVKRTRPLTKYKSLMDLYQTQYNIPFENMMVLKSDILLRDNWDRQIYQQTSGTILNKTYQYESIVENHKTLFMFDKSKIVRLKTDSHHHIIYLLQYFDPNQQKSVNLHYISLHEPYMSPQEEIHEYLENELFQSLKEDTTNNKELCCSEILETMQKMKEFSGSSEQHRLFAVYSRDEQPSSYALSNLSSSTIIAVAPAVVDPNFAPIGDMYRYTVYQSYEKQCNYNCILRKQSDDGLDEETFKMQIVHDIFEQSYILYTRYHDITNEFPYNYWYPSKDNAGECMVEFERVFYEKTMNKWKDRDCFKEYPDCYSYSKIDKDAVIHGNLKVLTFEINNKHPYILKSTEDRLKSMRMTSTAPFYQSVIEMNDDQKQQYCITVMNEDSNIAEKIKTFKPECESILSASHNMYMDISLTVSPLTTYRMIQNKISSEYFGGKLPANHIELYLSNPERSWIAPVHYRENQIADDLKTSNIHSWWTLYWDIVPYDTMQADISNMYQTNIYDCTKNGKSLSYSVNRLKQIFIQCDKDRDGALNKPEFGEFVGRGFRKVCVYTDCNSYTQTISDLFTISTENARWNV